MAEGVVSAAAHGGAMAGSSELTARMLEGTKSRENRSGRARGRRGAHQRKENGRKRLGSAGPRAEDRGVPAATSDAVAAHARRE